MRPDIWLVYVSMGVGVREQSKNIESHKGQILRLQPISAEPGFRPSKKI